MSCLRLFHKPNSIDGNLTYVTRQWKYFVILTEEWNVTAKSKCSLALLHWPTNGMWRPNWSVHTHFYRMFGLLFFVNFLWIFLNIFILYMLHCYRFFFLRKLQKKLQSKLDLRFNPSIGNGVVQCQPKPLQMQEIEYLLGL